MPEFPQFFLQAYKNSPVIDKVLEAGAHPTALITNNFTVRTVPSIHLFPNTKTVFEGEEGIQKFLDMYTARPLAQERAKKETPAAEAPKPEDAKPKAAKPAPKPKVPAKPKTTAKPAVKKESTVQKDVTPINQSTIQQQQSVVSDVKHVKPVKPVVRDVKPVPTTTIKKTRKA